MRIPPVLVFVLLLVLPAIAEDQNRELVFFSFDDTLAQVADGEGWTTQFVLFNMGDIPATFTVSFFGDDGNPLTLPFAGTGSSSTLTGSVAVGGSFRAETGGASLPVIQGWAEIETGEFDMRVAGMAILKRVLPGIPAFEAVVPFSGTDDNQIMPFDATGGFVTGVAVANTSSFSSLTVFFTFRDEGGIQTHLDSLTLQPGNHTAFLLSTQFPEVANLKGTVEFSTPDFGLSILGLRFNPDGAFTTVFPYEK